MASQTRLPTGDAATGNNWTASGGGAKYVEVDDPVGAPDDSTTYIYRENTNANQFVTFTAFDISTYLGTVQYVRLNHRSRRTDGTLGATRRVALKVNGTVYTAGAGSHTTSFADYETDYLTNPDTGFTWLEADVEGTGSSPLQECGISPNNITSGRRVEVTQVYLVAEYLPSAAGNPWYAYAQQ